MKIGAKIVPENRLPSLIDAVKTLYGKFGSKQIDNETVSRLLGHSTSRSGAYIQKRADMRSFGLIEPRGDIRVTELGRTITYPNNTQEEQEGLIQAIKNIELWKLIYEKYTEKEISLPSDFWTDIREWTLLPPEEAKIEAENVKKAYEEDIKYIKPVSEAKNMGDQKTSDIIDTNQAKPPEGLEQLTLGSNIKVWLPKGDKESAKKAIQLIKLYSGIDEKD